MNDQQRAAMREAISTLVKARARIVNCGGSGWKLEAQRCINAITALNEALAQPQDNLNCKSVQARLATLWGYVKAQPQGEPECVVCGTTENLHKDNWHGYRCDSEQCVCY